MKIGHMSLVIAGLLLAAGSVEARPAMRSQPVPAAPAIPAPPAVSPYETAPWWMRDRVIAQTGYAVVDVQANRGSFSGTFRGVDKTVAGAQAKAMDQVRGLQEALAKLGRDKVRIGTDFTMRALYREYRDRDGNMVEDQRGDRITGYEVTLRIDVTVLDLARLETAYALVQAASPVQTQDVYYWLAADNDLVRQLDGDALRDAHSRAMAAASAAGGGLGAARLIDPTGNACQSDMLAPTPRPVDQDYAFAGAPAPPPPAMAAEDTEMVVTAMRKAAPKTAADIEAAAAKNPFLQIPPMQRLAASACVVYELK